jgi:hypothetical protein
VKFSPFLQKCWFGFLPVRIGMRSINRTHFGASRKGKRPHAFTAPVRVYDIFRVVFGDSLIGALGFTSAAHNAFIINKVSHQIIPAFLKIIGTRVLLSNIAIRVRPNPGTVQY